MCRALRDEQKIWDFSNQKTLWRIPFWHICHISPVVAVLNSCCLSGLDLKRWDNAEVLQCWPPESGAVLSGVEIICLCILTWRHSWTSTSEPGLCVERGLLVELVLGAKKGTTSRIIINKLFLIAKKGATSKWVPTSCFWLQRKG